MPRRSRSQEFATYQFPINVKIDTQQVGGPVGRARLHPRDHRRPHARRASPAGKRVAVTGTISARRHRRRRSAASSRRRSRRARNGVQLMIVPKQEVADARRGAGDVQRGRRRRTSTRRWPRCRRRAAPKCRHRRRPRRDHEGMTDTSDSVFAARGSRTDPRGDRRARVQRRSSGGTPSPRCVPTSGWCRATSPRRAARERELADRVRELEEQLRKPALAAVRPGPHRRARRGDRPGARPGP